jgi:hypothetical protein
MNSDIVKAIPASTAPAARSGDKLPESRTGDVNARIGEREECHDGEAHAGVQLHFELFGGGYDLPRGAPGLSQLGAIRRIPAPVVTSRIGEDAPEYGARRARVAAASLESLHPLSTTGLAE